MFEVLNKIYKCFPHDFDVSFVLTKNGNIKINIEDEPLTNIHSNFVINKIKLITKGIVEIKGKHWFVEWRNQI